MPNGMSERSVLIEHCGVVGSVRKDTLYPIFNQIDFYYLFDTPIEEH